jgi:hypothetical protein
VAFSLAIMTEDSPVVIQFGTVQVGFSGLASCWCDLYPHGQIGFHRCLSHSHDWAYYMLIIR